MPQWGFSQLFCATSSHQLLNAPRAAEDLSQLSCLLSRLHCADLCLGRLHTLHGFISLSSPALSPCPAVGVLTVSTWWTPVGVSCWVGVDGAPWNFSLSLQYTCSQLRFGWFLLTVSKAGSLSSCVFARYQSTPIRISSVSGKSCPCLQLSSCRFLFTF